MRQNRYVGYGVDLYYWIDTLHIRLHPLKTAPNIK